MHSFNKKILLSLLLIFLVFLSSTVLVWGLCEDTDGGREYYIKGQIKIDEMLSDEDSCMEGQSMVEKCIINECNIYETYCPAEELKGAFEIRTCPEGCKNGACIKEKICPDVCTPLWRFKQNGKCIPQSCGSGCGPDNLITFEKEKDCLAQTSDLYFFNKGSELIVAGKNIKVEYIGTHLISVYVDKEWERLSEEEPTTINGLDITIQKIFYSKEGNEHTANLMIKPTTKKDIYISQNELLYNNLFIGTEENDFQTKSGVIIISPKRLIKANKIALNVSLENEEDSLILMIETGDFVNLKETGISNIGSQEYAVSITTSKLENLRINDQRVNNIWLAYLPDNTLGIFYSDVNFHRKFFKNLSPSENIELGETVSTNPKIQIEVYNDLTSFQVYLKFQKDIVKTSFKRNIKIANLKTNKNLLFSQISKKIINFKNFIISLFI